MCVHGRVLPPVDTHLGFSTAAAYAVASTATLRDRHPGWVGPVTVTCMSGRRTAQHEVAGLAELLAQQCGLARRTQLRELGVTRTHIAAHVAAGRWCAVAPEVISADNGRLDREQLSWRAVLHAPAGRIGGRSALETFGLRGYPPALVHVLCDRLNRPIPLEGVALHVTGRWPDDEPCPAPGLPRTPAARAVVDAAAWERWPRAAAGLTLAAVQQRIVTVTEIGAELALAGRVRHRAVVRGALLDATRGADSVAEVDIEPLLRRAGFTRWRRQVSAGGRRHDLEIDLADGTVLVLEIDGPVHDSPEARWADAARDAGIAAEGKLVVRISAYDIRHDPARVVAALRRIGDAARIRARRR